MGRFFAARLCLEIVHVFSLLGCCKPDLTFVLCVCISHILYATESCGACQRPVAISPYHHMDKAVWPLRIEATSVTSVDPKVALK